MKIATVCSGIGSPEQALKNLNIPHEITFACEIDKYARQTYLANFTPNEMLTDMTKEEWNKPEQYADLFIGGIPCQAFSLAGKRLGELDKRGLLFYDFYRYVKNQQPKVFIIENVKGLLSDAGGKTFQNWIQLLGKSLNTQNMMFAHEDSLGYNLHFKVLNSKDFGVPQNRERVFLVGIRADLPNDFRFPVGWRLDKRLKDILEPEVDEKYYLNEKMTSGFIEKPNSQKLGFINQETQSSGVFDINGLSPTVVSGTHGYVMGYIKEPALILEHTLSGGKWDRVNEYCRRVYDSNGLAPTVTTMQGGHQEPKTTQHNRIRRLTPLECFRLQGYPDSYIKPCSDTQTYKQAGNSITVTVMQAIIKNLLYLM